jgi:Spy/CpxP family protein refolding chaperone
MKLIATLVLLAAISPLFAADPAAAPSDPLAGAFFPPEIIQLARDKIGLTAEQQAAFRTRLQQTESRSDELRQRLEHETAALAAVARQDHVEEAALFTQLDKVLDAERELKHLHLGLLAAIKNLLTPEQQAKLREIAKDGGTQLGEDTRQRLMAKIERVKAGVQKWMTEGRDPSGIAQAMQEKVKPALDGGKPLEAEAELDRLIEQLNQDVK